MRARASTPSCGRTAFGSRCSRGAATSTRRVTIRATLPAHSMHAHASDRDVSAARRRVLLINPTITARRHARFPLSIMTMAAALEGRYDVDADRRQRRPRRRARRLRRRAQRSAFDAVGVTVMGGPQVATAIEVSRAVRARAARRCRSSGAATSRRCIRTSRSTATTSTSWFAARARTRSRELLDALAARRARGARRDRGPELAARRRPWSQSASARFTRGTSRRRCATTSCADPRAYLVKTFLGAAHGRAPGGARLPVPLHVLRRRGDVPRRDGVAAGRAPRPRARVPQARHRRRFDPVLRPQLLRPRRRHGAAARGARASRAAVVVLRARRRARQPLARNRGGSCARAACAWRTSAPRRRTTSYCKSIRKGTRSDQTLEVAELCRRHGVIPELSFMVAPPEDPGRRDRAHVRLHPPGQARESARRRSSSTSTRRCRPSSVPDSQRAASSRRCATCTARPWSFRRRPRSGPSGAGSTTPVTPTRRGSASGCGGASATSSRCCAAAFRPCRTRARRRWAQGGVAQARELALFAAPLRPAVGAARLAEPHRPARSARHEHLSGGAPMHVVQISFFVDPQRRAARDSCCATGFRSSTSRVAVAAVASASRSSRRACVPGTIVRAGVDVSFRGARCRRRRCSTRSAHFARCCASSRPTCFTCMASVSRARCCALRELAPGTPILLQDHADRVPRFWRRGAWRRGAAAASGMSFCARAQAEPFRRARLLPPRRRDLRDSRVDERVRARRPRPRRAPRRGLHGDPARAVGGPPRREQGSADRARGRERRRRLPGCSSGAASDRRRCSGRSKRASRATRTARARAPAGPRAARAGRAADARRRPVRARQSPRGQQLVAHRGDGHGPHARRDRHTVVARADGQRRRRSTLWPCGDGRASPTRCSARRIVRPATRARARAFRRAPVETRHRPALLAEAYHRIRGGARVPTAA